MKILLRLKFMMLSILFMGLFVGGCFITAPVRIATSVVSGAASVATTVVTTAASTAVSVLPINSSSDSKFSPNEYGVNGSPVVSKKLRNLPKGGGYRKIGKAYKIAGRWYYPKDYKRYSKTGSASWYGPTFHGRMTANGETFDRNSLTAAHPTLPLPSYARITNLANGRSVVVRVNDRGPYHSNRVIDLSERAAVMLGYKNKGTAKVKVVYQGKAPLDGLDHQKLLASFRSPNYKKVSAPADKATASLTKPQTTAPSKISVLKKTTIKVAKKVVKKNQDRVSFNADAPTGSIGKPKKKKTKSKNKTKKTSKTTLSKSSKKDQKSVALSKSDKSKVQASYNMMLMTDR